MFLDCATRNKEQPQLCESDFQRMFKALTQAERSSHSVQFSDPEEEALVDCRVLLEKYQKLGPGNSPTHDEAWGPGVQFFLSQTF